MKLCGLLPEIRELLFTITQIDRVFEIHAKKTAAERHAASNGAVSPAYSRGTPA